MVERYEGSAAPVYPRDLIATATEGQVDAIYVVDTIGRVDTTTIQVIQSNDPRFTESVRTALGEARFQPAKRVARPSASSSQQRFRFQIAPPSQTAPSTVSPAFQGGRQGALASASCPPHLPPP